MTIITELKSLIGKECWISNGTHKNFRGRILSYMGADEYLCLDIEKNITYIKSLNEIDV